MAQKRKTWNGRMSGFKVSDLVFLDESGCNTDMTRRYAYSLGGSRAVDSTVTAQRKNVLSLHLSKCQNSSIEKHVFLRAV